MAKEQKQTGQATPAVTPADPASVEAAQTADQAGQVTSRPTVTVALNRAAGIRFALPDGRTVLINGNAAHLRGKEKGVLPAGAFGLTTVAADDWAYIKKTYGRMEIFENGLIFAAERKADAADRAAEKAELRHGLEAADPETTPTRPDDGKE